MARRVISAEVRAAVMAAIARGDRPSDISRAHGVSVAAVRAWRAKAPPVVPETRAGLAAAVDPGSAGSLTAAVDASITALHLTARAGAVAELARVYAASIERAEQTARDAELIDLGDADASTHRRLSALRDRVEPVRVLTDLGPRLLAALTAIGGTRTGAAAAPTQSGAGDGSAQPAPSLLDLARARRAERQR